MKRDQARLNKLSYAASPFVRFALFQSRCSCFHSWTGAALFLLLAGALHLVAAAPSVPLDPKPAFTRITSGPVVSDTADGQGCAWVDIDNDGDLDLYITCNRTGKSLLYRNDGGGVFTRLDTGPVVNAGVGPVSASWADLDNDGRLDLFVTEQNNGPSLLFRHQIDGSFVRATLAPGGFSWGSAWADYDNDGFVDLLVGDSTRISFWHNDSHGALVRVTDPPPIGTNISNIVWGDYDNDGKIDVFVTGGAQPGRLFHNLGAGAFELVDSNPLANSSYGTGAAWGDYDNDGYLDLFLCRLDVLDFAQPFPSFLFHNNGDGTFTQVNQSPLTDDAGFAVSCSWGDYDNDGWLDLIVTDFGGGPNRLYRNNGNGTFARVQAESVTAEGGSSTGATWGDYDRDGFLDLFIANGTMGGGESTDYLYHNDGNTNSWITIQCVGTVSNRSAIGTKVRTKAVIGGKTVWQLREINTGDGWSNPPLESHFGLGNANHIETLRIEWPSGTVQEIQNVPAKQYLTIIEPPQLRTTVKSPSFHGSLKGGHGFQYDIELSKDLVVWSLLSTLTVTNLDGTAEFTDPILPSSGQRYYRARQR